MKRSDRLSITSCLALEQMADFRLPGLTLAFGRIGRFCLTMGIVSLMLLTASSAQRTSSLTSVVSITPSDTWALGNNAITTGGAIYASTLAEHWDGVQWTVVSTPNPQGGCSAFSAVAALNSNDVWAAGGIYEDVGNCGYTSWRAKPGFLEHWDGVSWKIVDSPSPATKIFTGIAAIAANDVWAVGYNTDPKSFSVTTLTEHWDGSRWTVVPSPMIQGAQQVYLDAVTAIATNDVWAVGSYSSALEAQAPFAEHWDGTTWKVVPVPETASGFFLFSASSDSANEVWATGYDDLALRWDGSRWISYPIANTNGDLSGLNGVLAFPGGEVWAVGYDSPNGAVTLTLAEHWDGVAWKRFPSPNLTTISDLRAVSGTSPSDVWAVGQYGYRHTLVEHWDGTVWTLVPSP
jgi:hypothetical protein